MIQLCQGHLVLMSMIATINRVHPDTLCIEMYRNSLFLYWIINTIKNYRIPYLQDRHTGGFPCFGLELETERFTPPQDELRIFDMPGGRTQPGCTCRPRVQINLSPVPQVNPRPLSEKINLKDNTRMIIKFSRHARKSRTV
jgi:hypothetical protein